MLNLDLEEMPRGVQPAKSTPKTETGGLQTNKNPNASNPLTCIIQSANGALISYKRLINHCLSTDRPGGP